MKNLKKGFTRLVILEALAVIIFIGLGIIEPNAAEPVLDAMAQMRPSGIFLLLILILIPLIRILLGVFVHENIPKEEEDGYETWNDGSDIRYEDRGGSAAPSPFQNAAPPDDADYEDPEPGSGISSQAPGTLSRKASPFYVPSFIRIQQLSGTAAIGSRDRVKVLDRAGTYQVIMDFPIPGTELQFEYRPGICFLLGQRDIQMIPDTPLVLYSTTPQGARIPQYALTFVTYEEASHA